jgi:hypothetical protein
MQHPRTIFKKILNTYLKELEEARNVQTRADALLSLRELLQDMNMYMDYEHKDLAIKKYIEDNVK